MEILFEPIEESLMALPLLFLACLFIEYLSNRNVINKVMEYGKLGPAIGAVVGCIPQCGFSVMAAKLLTMNVITPGTLLAVFIATSDEALSILAIHPHLWKMFMLLIVLKILLGTVTGCIYDKLKHDEDHYEYIQIAACDCGCQDGIFIPAVKHTLKIFVFILLTNIGLTLLIEGIGEDVFVHFLNTNMFLQPLAAGLVGFIPNCAGSVILTQLFVSGGLSFGALFAGLTTSAGVGTFALLTYMEDKKAAIRLLFISYLVAIISGYVIMMVGLYV
ncbi:MAG: putative manganese transporter [Faecalibacillus sp.]